MKIFYSEFFVSLELILSSAPWRFLLQGIKFKLSFVTVLLNASCQITRSLLLFSELLASKKCLMFFSLLYAFGLKVLPGIVLIIMSCSDSYLYLFACKNEMATKIFNVFSFILKLLFSESIIDLSYSQSLFMRFSA